MLFQSCGLSEYVLQVIRSVFGGSVAYLGSQTTPRRGSGV